MKIVLFDTETTDLIRNTALPLEQQPRVVELYAQLIEVDDEFNWTFIDEVDTLVNPGIRIPQESINITGITNEMVKDAPKMVEVMPKFSALLWDAEMVVAHNLSYDMGVMGFEQKRLHPDTRIEWPTHKVCTVEQTEHLKGFRLNLTALHELLFGVKFEGAHRAKDDVKAMTLCFKNLFEKGEI